MERCRVYCMQGDYYLYGAHITFISNKTQADITFSDEIIDFNSGIQYKSTHGEYVELKHFQYTPTNIYTSTQQFLFYAYRGNITGLLAFVVSEKYGLCVVDVKTDEIKSVLIPYLRANDEFSISVLDSSRPSDKYPPSIIVVHANCVMKFQTIPDNASSVKGVHSDSDKGKKTNKTKIYSLGGIESSNPTDGIYVKDGKKVLYK